MRGERQPAAHAEGDVRTAPRPKADEKGGRLDRVADVALVEGV
ncbi:hypothetical protein [Streptomyces flaveolus]|nr:hypothetical protein [Streptomyces flaveolus]